MAAAMAGDIPDTEATMISMMDSIITFQNQMKDLLEEPTRFFARTEGTSTDEMGSGGSWSRVRPWSAI